MRTLSKLLLLLVFVGVPASVSAQNDRDVDQRSIVYYTPKQNPGRSPIWIDDIQFTRNQTIVNMHYVKAEGGANLVPSTKLVCHLRGGKTKVLVLERTQGISMKKNRYTRLGRGEVFRAYFSPLPMADIQKIKSIDFLEDDSGRPSASVFNITDIKISKKHQVVR